MTHSKKENTDKLFESFSVKSFGLKNKIVMAPMTRTFSPDGVPTADGPDQVHMMQLGRDVAKKFAE